MIFMILKRNSYQTENERYKVMGRNTQSQVIKLGDTDTISAVARIAEDEKDETGKNFLMYLIIH